MNDGPSYIICVAMFPLSCAHARARTAFQPSEHSIFSVPTSLKSFHYYFEVIFCPLSQLFSLRSRKTAVSSYTCHPCTKVLDYTQWTKVSGASTSADDPDNS